MPSYQRSDLKAIVNSRLHNKIDLLSNVNITLNNGVREAYSLLDLRSAKRKATLAPALFDEIYTYYCPSDMKGIRVVGLQPQNMERDKLQAWELTTQEEFDQRKECDTNLLAFADGDFVRKLLVSYHPDDTGFTVDALDTATNWSGFGDGTNLSTDNYQYIKGSGSVKFDISAAGGTTAGIVRTNIPNFDLTNYKSAGSIFVWAWVTSPTNLTNYISRVGSSSSNYYQMTATTTNEGTSFVAGWNLIRFDFSGKTTVGTPVDGSSTYAAVYMTKTAGKVSETDYRFDQIIVKQGQIFNLLYYSKYAWQSNVGVYKLNSTADTDYINADEDEFSIIVEKCVEHAGREMRETEDVVDAQVNYKTLVKEYRKQYKSEALPSQSTYYYI